MDADTVRLLNACTNSNISISEGEEKMDMCLGMKEWIEEEREEVRAEERANTERERQRADKAEAENDQLRKEIERLKAQKL